MHKFRLWRITVILLLLVIVTLPPPVSAFNYIHYWRTSFSGSLEVTGDVSMPIEPYWSYIGNTTWQTCEQISFRMTLNESPVEIIEIDADVDGNPHLTLNLSSRVQPGEVLSWDEEWLFTVVNRRPMLPHISIAQSGTIGDIQWFMEPEDYSLFTRGTSLWKTGNATLIEIAQLIADQIPGQQQDPRQNALALVLLAIQWIQDNISRSSGVTEPQYPEETIVSMIGDCDDQSNLLITFLRIYGIPSYLTTGHWFQEGARTSGFIWGSLEDNAYRYVDYLNSVGHGWVMVYIPPWGWLPFDLFSLEQGTNPIEAYTQSLFASTLPFVTLWQIISSDYIAQRRAEEADLFTYEIHRIELEEWTSLGSIPIIDAEYLVTNMATLIALILTLGFLTFLVGLAVRRATKEEPNRDSKAPIQ